MTLYEITYQKLNYLGYSHNTIKTYLHYVGNFEDIVDKHYTRITSTDVQNYLYSYNFTSRPQQNQVISSLKFAWHKALGRKYLKIDFKRPRKEKKLPRIIDPKTTAEQILSVKNLKHKAILSLGLSCGLRISKVVNLKIKDIDSEQMIISVNDGKGRKDRVVPLSENLLSILRDYFKVYRPYEYLFNGQNSLKYSTSSCSNLVKTHLGPDKHFHLLRHTALTSMLENGADVRVIQVIAGHNSLNTTAGYLHVSKKYINQVQTPI